nr:uncharacterized protein LOC113707873 [Coffea arabica]
MEDELTIELWGARAAVVDIEESDASEEEREVKLPLVASTLSPRIVVTSISSSDVRREPADQCAAGEMNRLAAVASEDEELNELQGRVGNLSPRGESNKVRMTSDSSSFTAYQTPHCDKLGRLHYLNQRKEVLSCLFRQTARYALRD